MIRIDTVVGLDIGTTTSKALIRPLTTAEPTIPPSIIVGRPTTWMTHSDGGADIDASTLLRTACELLAESLRSAEDAWGAVRVRAISVTGLAESGVLLGPDGRPRTPTIAWYDQRGHDQLAELAARDVSFAARFPRLTGLPWSCQASFAKLLWLRANDAIPAGSRWFSVPEWIVHALGGEQVREPSLAARTGLIRQDTGDVWDTAAGHAGLPPGLLPDAVTAGEPVGKADHPDVPDAVAGAWLSVAGHDHPVAALAVGAAGPDDLFNSAGTADVLARAVTASLSEDDRDAVVAAGWSAGAHIVPGVDLLLAGGSGGLLLRRVLAALGADEPQARAALDAAAGELTELPPGLQVDGDGRTDADVTIRIGDGAHPAAIWSAAVNHTAQLTRRMLDDVAPTVGSHRRTVAAGGWIRMASVRAAKTRALAPIEFSDIGEPGAAGAALVAEFSLDADRSGLGALLSASTTEPMTKSRPEGRS